MNRSLLIKLTFASKLVRGTRFKIIDVLTFPLGWQHLSGFVRFFLVPE